MTWAGNSRWVDSMEWSGKKAFVSSAEKPFTVDGKEAGVLKSYGPLSFLKVRKHKSSHPWINLGPRNYQSIQQSVIRANACCVLCVTLHRFAFYCETNSRCCWHYHQVHDSGHMVPMDQPKVALEMLKRWTSGNLSDASSSSQRLDFAM